MEILLRALKPFDFNSEEAFDTIEQPLDFEPGSIVSFLCNELALLPIEKESLMTVVNKLPSELQGKVDLRNLTQKIAFEHVVILLTSENTPKTFMKRFIITFPLFNSPKYLLACLFARFFTNISSASSNISTLSELGVVRVQVLKFLVRWMKSTPFVFTADLLGVVKSFYNRVSFGHVSKDERYVLHKLRDRIDFLSVNDHDEINTLIKRTFDDKTVSIRPNVVISVVQKLQPRVIAEQIALVDSAIFRSVSPKDLMGMISGQMTAKSIPSIDCLQHHFDKLSTLVAFSIIFDFDVKIRATMYATWVKILFELYKVRDYSGMFAVYGGITHPSVMRLKNTNEEAWKMLGFKTKLEYGNVSKICSFFNNFAAYRQTLQYSQPPLVPFFGCFQKDWVYFQELLLNPSDNKIEIPILEKAYDLYSAVQKYQTVKYDFEENQEMLKILLNSSKELPDSIKLMQISALQESQMRKYSY